MGRDFAAADEQPGAPPVAILRYELWQQRYGGDAAIVGRTIRINGTPTTVIGVMPPGFAFPQNQDVWLPLVATSDREGRDDRSLWFAFGRLSDGATVETARAELAVIGRRLANAHPETNESWVPSPRTFAQFFIDSNADTIYGSLWAAVGFVLLIACANLANLQLARALGRTRDTSLRLALGASRLRLVRPIVIESLLLSSAGGLIGWMLATWGIRSYEAIANPPTRAWSTGLLDYRMDSSVLLYALAISIGTGLIFGLAPTVRISRLDVHASLKDGGRGAGRAAGATGLSTWLMAVQFALSVVLTASAVAMTRSTATLSAARQTATSGDIVRLILRQGLWPLGIGLIFGLAALIPANRILQSQLVGVSAADLTTVVFVSAVLVASALVGSLIPARRATRVSPLIALRFE